MKKFLFNLLFFISYSLSYARVMSIDDVFSLKTIESVRLAPDRHAVLCTVKSINIISNIISSGIYLINTNSDPSNSVKIAAGSLPIWSPDSKTIAFLKSANGVVQIFSRPENGTNSEMLTYGPRDVAYFAWSPDGRYIAYTMPSLPISRDNNYLPSNIIVVDQTTQYQNLRIYDFEKKTNYQLTDGAFVITSFAWSPGCGSLAFSAKPSFKDQDSFFARLYTVDIKTASLQELVSEPGSYGAVRWSPDGRNIAFLSRNKPNDWLEQYRLKIIRLNSRIISDGIKDGRGDISSLYDWSSDGKFIYFQTEKGVTYQLCRVDTASGKTEQLTAGNSIFENFSFDKDFLKTAFIMEDSEHPPEIYISSIDDMNGQPLTAFNGTLKAIEKGETEIIQWKNGKWKLEGILVKPVDFQNGRKYPLLTIIHGGPTSCFSIRFLNGRTAYPAQVFAGLGYMVFMPNPRGSSGCGDKIRKANRLDWGGGDYRDILAGINMLFNKGLADKNRLGVMGWSYGGYLTAWTISHTNIFKAASVGGGISDIYSLYGTIDIPDWLDTFFKGPPYRQEILYLKHSPLYYAERIKTPVLIQHGGKDVRVPVSQAWELYTALKRRNIQTEFVIYQGQPHNIADPQMRKDCIQRNIDWFERFLK